MISIILKNIYLKYPHIYFSGALIVLYNIIKFLSYISKSGFWGNKAIWNFCKYLY